MRWLPLVVLLASAGGVAAQQASPYLPLQHWSMPYVEHLIAAGVLKDPTPLTRPLKQADLVRALEAIDTLKVSEAVQATVNRMLRAFRPMAHGPRYRLEGTVGLAAATYNEIGRAHV